MINIPTTTIQAVIPQFLADRLRAMAEEENRSLSNLIHTMLFDRYTEVTRRRAKLKGRKLDQDR
jgi:hypothetical protein